MIYPIQVPLEILTLSIYFFAKSVTTAKSVGRRDRRHVAEKCDRKGNAFPSGCDCDVCSKAVTKWTGNARGVSWLPNLAYGGTEKSRTDAQRQPT
jgi:hypothetical protein